MNNCEPMSRSYTATNFPSSPAMAHRMVKTELDAAEVLVNLFSSTPEASTGGGGGGESIGSWGSRSKQSSVRVKSPSSPFYEIDKEKEEKKTVPLAFDLNEDQASTFNQEEAKDLVKGDKDGVLAEPSPPCTGSHTSAKSRQNLTEAEKEARRLRRVLANRESARQTIRRRQAVYEELTRKVADLVRENEDLKREKESAITDYQALKSSNNKLNEEIAEQLGSKVEENAGKSTSANCSIPALRFANCPYFSGPNGGRWWCMVPYPSFFPMSPEVNNGTNLIPFFPGENKENETCMDKQDIDVKTKASTSVEIPLGFSLDGCSSLQSCTSQSDDVRGAMGLKPIIASNSEAISAKGVDDSNLRGKRLVDPAAAAKARKRRKELTKLKSLHYRAHRKQGLIL